jgi:hypothetical protein
MSVFRHFLSFLFRLLDFDDTPFKTVKNWSERACNWFNLGGFIILRSSKNRYHAVFDRSVTWIENMHIMCWVASESRILALKNYVLMQGIKESSTLRIGNKGKKSFPRIILCHGENCNEVAKFLLKRAKIKQLQARMFESPN